VPPGDAWLRRSRAVGSGAGSCRPAAPTRITHPDPARPLPPDRPSPSVRRVSAPYQQPPPPGASPFRRWLARVGGAHPDEPPPGAAPAKPQWRWTIVAGTTWAALGGAAISPWVGLGMVLLTAAAAVGEYWAWERAGAEGPGWKPLGVAFWASVAGGAVAIELLSDESFLLIFAAVAPFATAIEQIGRGIRAERDGAPRPGQRAPAGE